MELTLAECLIRMVKEIGFPAVAFILLWLLMSKSIAPRLDRISNNMDKNTNAITGLETSVKNHLNHAIGDLKGSVDKNTEATRDLKDEVKKLQK
jgi:hypothetical protein